MNLYTLVQCMFLVLVVPTLSQAQEALYKSVEEIDLGQDLSLSQINEYIGKNWDALGGFEKL